MIIPSWTRSRLLPKAPPFARRRGLRCAIDNVRAQLRGARDSDVPVGSDGLQPTTAAWQRQVDQVAAQIDEALRTRLDSVDRQITQTVGRIRRHETRIAQLAGTVDTAAAATFEQHSLAGSENDRLVRQARNALDGERAALARAQEELHQLGQVRHHLHKAARDVADSWSNRCDQLVALHRRGYLRAQARSVAPPSGGSIDLPLPRHISVYEWAHDIAIPVNTTLPIT